jgi:hypothetical protein
MPQSAKTTTHRVGLGVKTLEQLIRNSPISAKLGTYVYDGRVSMREVLRLAGIRSAATLHHTHHRDTLKWLRAKVNELKALAGRGKRESNIHEVRLHETDRLNSMAQKLAAANYQIVELERRVRQLSLTSKSDRKVVPLRKRRT